MCHLWASALYTIQVSALYRMVERTIEQYIARLVFIEMSLLSQTRFLSLLKALEAFDVCVSSSASSQLLVTVVPRYLNIFILVNTGSLSVCLGQCDEFQVKVSSWLIFSPNAFKDLEKWLIISRASWL